MAEMILMDREPERYERPFDELRFAVHSIWNRRWLALGIAWAICLLGWLVVALIPNSYESKAKVEFACRAC